MTGIYENIFVLLPLVKDLFLEACFHTSNLHLLVYFFKLFETCNQFV